MVDTTRIFRRFPTLSTLLTGFALSIILRAVVPASFSFTIATPFATYYLAGNVVSCWAMILLTLAASGYIYMRRNR